jgi:rubrerythrin
MNGNTILELLDEAINLELNIQDLYVFYSKTYSRDHTFWWKLQLEEGNHASLLKALRKELQETLIQDASSILSEDYEELKKANDLIKTTLTKWKSKPASQSEAYQFALKLEQSAQELHLQNTIEKESELEIIKLFKKLTGSDRDHAKRISELLASSSP